MLNVAVKMLSYVISSLGIGSIYLLSVAPAVKNGLT